VDPAASHLDNEPVCGVRIDIRPMPHRMLLGDDEVVIPPIRKYHGPNDFTAAVGPLCPLNPCIPQTVHCNDSIISYHVLFICQANEGTRTAPSSYDQYACEQCAPYSRRSIVPHYSVSKKAACKHTRTFPRRAGELAFDQGTSSRSPLRREPDHRAKPSPPERYCHLVVITHFTCHSPRTSSCQVNVCRNW